MNSADSPDRLAALVVEDDETIGRLLHEGLGAGGYAARWARTGHAGLVEARRTAPDVVLLDLGLPDIDGVEVARQLRSALPDTLLVILTARAEEIDVIVGLDAGADDYLVKPFSLTVLLARLRAHLRRRPSSFILTSTTVGDLHLAPSARRCFVAGAEISLRPKEFELLEVLVQHLGVAVSRETLMSQVWDENWFGPTKTLDVTMASLRRRLSEASAASPLSASLPVITTLRGHGYRMDPPDPA